MPNRIDSFVVAPGALSAWVWIPALEGINAIVALIVGLCGFAIAYNRWRVSRLDLKLKKAEAAARGIEL